jgi:signal transduction histidine kinase
MIRLFRYSLSLRLLAIFLLLGALFAWGVVAGLRWAYSADDLRSLISGHLSLHVDYVRRDIGDPPRLDRALAITRRVPVDIRIDGPDLRWSSDPAFPDPATLQFGPSEYFSDRPGALLQPLQGVDFATRANHSFLRFAEGPYRIIVVTPKIATRRERPPLIPILVGFALLLILGGYLAVRWLFRPLVPIREGAAYIGAGHFEHRIETHRDDELGALAADINAMAGKVQGMLDAKRQLLLGVSHELRSPLSRMNLGLALLEDSPPVRSLRQDVNEMSDTVDTLLQAERLGSRHATLERREVSLGELAQALAAHFALEPRLQIEVGNSVRVALDEARILLMLKNLIGNALRYAAPEDGPVELLLTATRGAVEFRVRDYGPGISADQRAHLGEPFYRSDASRARQTGGTGLGLYLARQVALAHGGELRLADCEGRGALFVVTLPLARQL